MKKLQVLAFVVAGLLTCGSLAQAAAKPGAKPAVKCSFPKKLYSSVLAFRGKELLAKECPKCTFMSIKLSNFNIPAVTVTDSDLSSTLATDAVVSVAVAGAATAAEETTPTPTPAPAVVAFNKGVAVKTDSALKVAVCVAEAVDVTMRLRYKEEDGTRKSMVTTSKIDVQGYVDLGK